VDEAALAEATMNAGVALLTDPILPRLRVAVVAIFFHSEALPFLGLVALLAATKFSSDVGSLFKNFRRANLYRDREPAPPMASYLTNDRRQHDTALRHKSA
jgi:hypothetical protein